MFQSLLQGLVDHPHDADRWLILADWIEENDDPRRAELVRWHQRLLATCTAPEDYPERLDWQARVVSLLAEGVQAVAPRQTHLLSSSVQLQMAWIPPGTFLMGSPTTEYQRSDDETRHRVTLTEGFWLGVHPVTQAQWQALMGNNPCLFKGDDLPVEKMSWHDCQDFVAALARQVGPGFRLPTEAEWEYACRAGTTTPFSFGKTLSSDQANYNGFYAEKYSHTGDTQGVYHQTTTPVGSYPANAWGLHDMHGNVWEWCADWYEPHAPGDVTNPRGPRQGRARVYRGGSRIYSASNCRAAWRPRTHPSTRDYNFGFRLARSIPL